MRHLFHSQSPDETPSVEPIPTVFPQIEGADIAAVFVGKRIAGDFYDSVRVSPERVLFGMLDVAGRRETNRDILSAAQEIFRNLGTELFSRPDINESEAMTELSLRINRGIIETSKGVRSCPAFFACYHEKFGTLCYTNAGHTPGLLRDVNGITNLGFGRPALSDSFPTPPPMLLPWAWKKARFCCSSPAESSTARDTTDIPPESSGWSVLESFCRMHPPEVLRLSVPIFCKL